MPLVTVTSQVCVTILAAMAVTLKEYIADHVPVDNKMYVWRTLVYQSAC
jgi:hypothetical protein